ncbi:MAG: pyridoxine 5'-phosphate synthase [Candidatus Kapaibacterium sp.]|nr:pyridoxine 5'-phosphate synthase [Ignavibacteriota bacterium]MCB9220983.1 pyridoxine 5'-phosphate synthase [Ignavibacteria bacterium]
MILNVNIDHVATLRNARGEKEPDVLEAALIAEAAGAKGIVCHLREDRRHIKDADVYLLKNNISTLLNFEMAMYDDIIALALDVVPHVVTIVPEGRLELTTEGGLNVLAVQHELITLCKKMHDKGIKVSLFIEPDKTAVEIAKSVGADMVELHTGTYANLSDETSRQNGELIRINEATLFAKSLGLRVAAGHGLNLDNTAAVAKIREIDELSIGHSIISNSLKYGLEATVKKFISIIEAN